MSRTASESYRPRSVLGPRGDCLEIEVAGICWGPVRDSSSGMKCEGHRHVVYRREPVPPTPEELALRAEAQAESEKKNRLLMRETAYKWGYTLKAMEDDLRERCPRGWGPTQWGEWQAKRWFRPFMYGVGEVKLPEWLEEMPLPMLTFLHSAIGHFIGWERNPAAVNAELRRIGALATRALQLRGVKQFPRGPYDLDLLPASKRPSSSHWMKGKEPFPEKDLKVRADLLTESELRVIDNLTAEVEDFSCLNWGTRIASSSWHHQTYEEVKRRGLDHSYLLEETVLPIPSMVVEQGGQRIVGYWAPKTGRGVFAGLPVPESYIDPSWSDSEREAVLRYLAEGYGPLVVRYMGSSYCRICDKENGCSEFTDGTYTWPEGLAHYVRDHGLKPAQEFIDHALRST